jgi:glycosyltransferase involved in cell wall biosynthesis
VAGLVVFHSEASMGWGGQELRILGEMEQFARRGHRLGLIAQPASQILVRARGAGFPVHAVRMRGPADLAAACRIARLLRAEGAQLLNTHSSVDAWVGGIAARWLGLPVVRTRHLAIRIRRNPVSPMVYTWLADRIVTTGAEGREILIEQAGAAPGRVAVVPTGVDTARFAPEAADGRRIRRALGFTDETPVVGIVAVIRRRKGHQVLLEAVASAPLRGRGTHLVIAGEGPVRGQVEARAAELGLQEWVHFLGHREDVPDLLAACDVVALPSVLGEGVPQTILQALAVQRPVVASDVAGIRQVVRHDETGLLVPPEDPRALAEAIARLLADPETGRRLGAAGRALVASGYSVTHMADAMERVYAATVL